MSAVLPDVRSGSSRATTARPLWNAYLVGVLLGLVLLASYLVVGQGLGATGAFSAVTAAIAGALAPEHARANPVYWYYLEDGRPLMTYLVFLVAGVFIGGFVSGALGRRIGWTVEKGPRSATPTRLGFAFAGGVLVAIGAKLAKGCTSGQALSGGAILNVGSLVFMVAAFAAGYAFAYFFRKQWT
jgi:uncharacterized membrane protein YedE/YeeE